MALLMQPEAQVWAGRRRRWILLVFAWAWFAALAPAAPRAATSSEYQLKAVFLFNFAQFVEWPDDAFATDTAPLIIGVLGDDPFGPYLDDLVRGEKVGGHPLAIRRFRAGEVPQPCQILFVSNSEAPRVNAVLSAVKGGHVLTVSDIDGFARLGGMVRFSVEDGRIRLRVNVAVARAANLVISSKILRASAIVSSGKD